MNIEFILAQISGVIVLILMSLSTWFNDNKKIVFISILANCFSTAQYFLLGAITGAIISILNIIRCIIFFIYKKKNLKPSLTVLIIFEILAVVCGIISWQNWWSIIPICMAIIYTYGLWQDNTFIIKLSTAIVGAGWFIYNIVVKAYVGAIQSLIQFLSSIAAIIKDKLTVKSQKISSVKSVNINIIDEQNN